MKHPILKTSQSGCMIKIQKRSESNVLANSPKNKSIESKRLRKWLIPSTIDDPWSWVKQKIKGHFFACSRPARGAFLFLLHRTADFRHKFVGIRSLVRADMIDQESGAAEGIAVSIARNHRYGRGNCLRFLICSLCSGPKKFISALYNILLEFSTKIG